MARYRVLLYDDVAIFGGHEEMTLNALRSMVAADDLEVGFVYSCVNRVLEARLQALAAEYPLTLLPFAYTTGSLQFLRTPLAVRALSRLRNLIREFRADCVLVIQGEISLSSLALLAARMEGRYTLSYIPLAQSRSEREGGLFAALKDLLLSPYYRLPHAFMTISASQATLLRERGATQPIAVVENGIDTDGLVRVARDEARRRLGLPETTPLVGLVGRVESQQKGHDILIEAIASHREKLPDWMFVIAGSGPDEQAIQAATHAAELQDRVLFLPWQHDLSLLYSALDMLVIPSRFEGVPVVLLEAMYMGLPIIASDRDAMHDLLPAEWLFPTGDSAALVETLLHVAFQDKSLVLAAHREVILQRFTLQAQAQTFCDVVHSFMEQSSGHRNTLHRS